MMLRWLPRPALPKARIVPGDREQVIVTDEPDPAVDALVARSAAALDSIAVWPEDQIDALIAALAAQIAAHADELAAATVAETGIGCVPDKAVKNRFASLGVARSLIGKPGVGVVGGSGPEGADRDRRADGRHRGPDPGDQPGSHAGVQGPDLHQGTRRAHRQLPPRRGRRRRQDRRTCSAGSWPGTEPAPI